MKSDIKPTKFLLDFSKDMNIDNIGNEKNFMNLPYKLCANKGKKLKFLEFWLFNENTNKLHRRRKECPQKENFNKWFKETSLYVNDALRDGYRITLNAIIAPTTETPPEKYNIIDAIEKIHVLRANGIVSVTTANRHNSFKNVFFGFLKKEKLHNNFLADIEKKHIQGFLDSLVMNSVSKNTYLSYIKAIFNNMLERDWISTDPTKSFKKFAEEETASIAFLPEHQKELKNLLIEEDTELYIFCMCIFYTFVRPIELRRLKVSQVNLKDKKIQIIGKGAKNKKTQYVMIPKPLADIFTEYKFLERPANDYLFSSDNDIKYSRNKFSTAFSALRDKHEFPDNYTLYCWKHTGVVEYYKMGCGIKFIQMQCRHSSLDETDKYLKSLGLFENDDILNNAPEI